MHGKSLYKMFPKKTPREIWKKAYRLARNPDSFLADPLTIDFPFHYMLYALKCVDFKLGKGSYKDYE